MLVWCIVVGNDERYFPVDIEDTKTVAQLKDEIKKKKHRITCDADELDLYLALKDKQWLPFDVDSLSINKIHLMVPHLSLSHYFNENGDPKFESTGIHVVVELPAIVVSDRSSGLTKVGSQAMASKKRRLEELKNELPAPSSFAKCRGKTSWIHWLKKSGIECHRQSSDISTIPIVLLHPVFANFDKNRSTIAFGN
ncbi:hypothetical protein THRCLA_23070, partial [Thraustotheca clavata]